VTEWQCDVCAHVNEKTATVCDDCQTPHNYASACEEIENLRSRLSSAREALAEIAGMATYVEGSAHAARIAAKGLATSDE